MRRANWTFSGPQSFLCAGLFVTPSSVPWLLAWEMSRSASGERISPSSPVMVLVSGSTVAASLVQKDELSAADDGGDDVRVLLEEKR